MSFPGAEDLLARLESGLPAHGNEWSDRHLLATLGSFYNRTLFQEVFISEQLHTQKPEPAFLPKLLTDSRVQQGKRTLMIGDSLTADIAGGNAAGIDTVWYNP